MTVKNSKKKCDKQDVPTSPSTDYSHLKSIVDLSPAILYTCQPDGDFGATFISENVRDQLGYEPSEFIGNRRFWASRVHPDDKPKVLKSLRKISVTETQTYEYRFLHKDGTYRWMHDEIRVLKAQNEKPVELVGSWMDITEGKEVEKSLHDSQARLEEAQRIANLGSWEWDIVNNKSWCSDGTYRIFGFNHKTFDGSYESFLTFVHPEDRGLVEKAMRQTLSERAPYAIDYRIVRPDGSVRHVYSKGRLTLGGRGEPVRLTGTVLDVTTRKKLENELFRAKSLEVIGQLAAGVAHEVRNPLNAILSIVEALFKEEAIATNPEYQPYLNHIRTQVDRLSGLMSDLLDLGGSIPARNSSLLSPVGLCSDCIDLWKMSETAKGHPITFAVEPHSHSFLVHIEANRLKQVLLNLLDNAAQNSPEGGEILVNIFAMGNKNKIAIQIKDSGQGIAPEKIGRIFEPFFSMRKKGTGLGLTLVKHFVENMDGTIDIRNNEPPPGCTAELILNIEKGKGLR